MTTAIHLGLLMHLFVAGPQLDPGQYIRIERLSPRVVVAYWPGIDRRCNLTAISSQKGLVLIDTEASPRIMAPIKEKIEQAFHRTDTAPTGHTSSIRTPMTTIAAATVCSKVR